ncbi:MAG: hypothetical protein GX606_04315 [Elusimicrobia bacterium]|nr:hypothetical protein [Elusimicrobiota bacterium]
MRVHCPGAGGETRIAGSETIASDLKIYKAGKTYNIQVVPEGDTANGSCLKVMISGTVYRMRKM